MGKTMIEAKEHLRKNWEKGTNCPCCNQLVRRWNYSIHSTMARLLISLYHKSKDGIEYHHINDLWDLIGNKSMGGDFAKLTLWKMIEKKPKDLNSKKRSTGFWKITQIGKDFVEKKITAPKHIFVYNGKNVGISNDFILISQALGNKFDYLELIKRQKDE